jgi:hypothetical protein
MGGNLNVVKQISQSIVSATRLHASGISQRTNKFLVDVCGWCLAVSEQSFVLVYPGESSRHPAVQ